MIYSLRGTKPDGKGRGYLSGGGHLLQLWQGQTAANLEGGEQEGLSEARDAWGRFALAQGEFWLANCVRCLGNGDGLPVLFDRAVSGGRGGRQVEGTASKCCRVAEDVKVLQRGRGVSGVSGGEDDE